MSNLPELYQAVLLEHAKNPRNAHLPEGANRTARSHNPLCGDRIELALTVDQDTITAVGYRASGCAISRASASVMSEAIRGKSLAQVRALSETFHALVTGRSPEAQPESQGAAQDPTALGDLAAFGGVAEFPMRVSCATLAWQALTAALTSNRNDAPG